MKKVCVVTTTRADYGLLAPTIKKLAMDKEIDLTLLVGGTHLLNEFGMTKNEIIQDGFSKYIKEVPIIKNANDTPCQIFAQTITEFEKELSSINPDCVVILGDRFEILAVASACTLLNIPLVHISGGDVTMGAIDDACRHATTKMANLHFTGSQHMANRVIQMGENPDTVFNVGEPGIENILNTELLSFDELKQSLKWDSLEKGKYIVFTYHPETLNDEKPLKQIKNLIKFVKKHSEFQYIITKSNIDCGGQEINDYIKSSIKGCNNIIFVDSLGYKRYLSAVKYCALVMGNSSSGIVEVPYLSVPTINIGNRQQGREQAHSIVNTDLQANNLEKALQKCNDIEFRNKCKDIKYIYGDGNTSAKIVQILKQKLNSNNLQKKKEFFEKD